ncbi:Fc.00g010630.m01.CDS01 [Cosmosporella sp. VM-42]
MTRKAVVCYGGKAEHVDRDNGLANKQKEIQRTTVITIEETDYINTVINSYNFRQPAVCATRQYRVFGFPVIEDALTKLEQLSSINSDSFPVLQCRPTTRMVLEPEVTGSRASVLNAESRILYISDDPGVCLEQGRLEACSLEYQQYDLALSSGMAAEVGAKAAVENLSDVRAAVSYSELDADGCSSGTISLKSARTSFYVPGVDFDPVDNATTTVFDHHLLLPNKVIDSMGKITSFVHDYRHLRPNEVEDHNMNRQMVCLGPFGEELGHAQTGKRAQDVGDSPEGFQHIASEEEITALINDLEGATAREILRKAGNRTSYGLNQYTRERASGRGSTPSIIHLARQDTF